MRELSQLSTFERYLLAEQARLTSTSPHRRTRNEHNWPWPKEDRLRLRLIALVLLVVAATAGAFVLTRADTSSDAWLVLATGLALAAVTGALVPTRKRRRLAMGEVER
jgi:hypothetical protein